MIRNAVIDNMLKRRSIRRFRQEQISEEELATILQAGLYAPSAGGRQGVIFVVSQDKDTNEKLGRRLSAKFGIVPDAGVQGQRSCLLRGASRRGYGTGRNARHV